MCAWTILLWKKKKCKPVIAEKMLALYVPQTEKTNKNNFKMQTSSYIYTFNNIAEKGWWKDAGPVYDTNW